MTERSLIEQAARIAYTAHARQTRKDDGSPYFIHPCMVALKLAAYGFDEKIIAAGYVHDVLEDTSVTKEALEQALGSEVVRIVLSVTEDKSLPWEERKKSYIVRVCEGSDGAKAVSLADKIHNIESMLSAYQTQGSAIWKIFTRGRDAQRWFQESLLYAVRETWHHPFVDEYTDAVACFLKLK